MPTLSGISRHSTPTQWRPRECTSSVVSATMDGCSVQSLSLGWPHSSGVSPQHGCYCVTCLAGSGLKGKSANHRSRASLVPDSPENLYFVLSFKISFSQPSLCLNRTEQNRRAVFLEGCRRRGDNGNTLGFNITSSELTRGVCPGERPTVCPFSAEDDDILTSHSFL